MYTHITNSIIKLQNFLSAPKFSCTSFLAFPFHPWLKTATGLISFLLFHVNGVIVYPPLWLASLCGIMHDIFEIHPFCWVYQWLVPFHCLVVLHYMTVPHFGYYLQHFTIMNTVNKNIWL